MSKFEAQVPVINLLPMLHSKKSWSGNEGVIFARRELKVAFCHALLEGYLQDRFTKTQHTEQIS